MPRVRVSRVHPQDGAAIAGEATSTDKGIALRPQANRRKPGSATDSGPRIRVVCPQTTALKDRVEKQPAVRGKVALLRIDTAFDPRAVMEPVVRGFPPDDVKPARSAPIKNDGFRRFSGGDGTEPRRRKCRKAGARGRGSHGIFGASKVAPFWVWTALVTLPSLSFSNFTEAFTIRHSNSLGDFA